MVIELYVDLSCPYAYLGSTRIEEVAARAGVELIWRPMLLGGVFRAVGTPDRMSEGMPPGKARHNGLDMMRWAELWEVPLHLPAGHPIRTVRALRALLSLPEASWPPVIHALYRAYWVDGVDVSTEAGLRAALAAGGVTGDALARALAAGDDPAIKDELRRRTDEAVGRGVFGAPTAFVGQRPGDPDALMFWGQDRFPMVEAAAAGWRPPRAAPALPLLPPAPPPAPPVDGRRRTLEFFYDFSSPFAYLGATQIERVAREAGAALRWRPMLLGGLFRAIGTPDVPMLATSAARRRYHAAELAYWSSWWQVPFTFQSRFPVRTVAPLRLALAAGPRIAEVSHAFFRAAWAEDRDLEDEATQRALLTDLGLDADALLARTRDPALKQQLIDATDEAARRGVFGAPTAIVGWEDGAESLFWGQDRLDLAGRAAAGWRPGAG